MFVPSFLSIFLASIVISAQLPSHIMSMNISVSIGK